MSIKKRDYYEILGINKGAHDGEIKRAYRKLAMEFHPDRNPGDHIAEEKFKEAAEAYQVLSDPEKRSHYDRFGHSRPSMGGGSPFSNFDDIFSAFSDIFGGGSTVSSKGEDLQVGMKISFKEAVTGANKDLSFERPVVCDTCNGTGAKPGTQKMTCRLCRGRGQVHHQQGFFSFATTCPECQGEGAIIATPCTHCKGKTYVMQKDSVNIRIPAGVDTGTQLRLSGLGALGSKNNPGDLYVVFEVEKDSIFERSGDDLRLDVPLSFVDATLGATIEISTLDGPESFHVKPGTTPYHEEVLKGRGVPNVRGRGKGDLILRFVVQIPRKLSKEAKLLLEELKNHLDRPSVIQEKESDQKSEESVLHKIFGKKKKAE